MGLLLLRVAAALAPLGLIVVRPAAWASPLQILGSVLLILGSLAVLVGLLTTGSAILLAATIVWFWFPVHAETVHSNAPAALLTIADAIAISLLGPGAFSIDARLFGPREITVSGRSVSAESHR
jgi:uncharacterized membrane protein YphA (DoxX/SURF4 family)